MISLYNQDHLENEPFVASFVARGPVLNLLVDGLRDIAAGGETEHRVLIGMRGMGKTSMLRRISIAIGEDDRLRDAFLPLRFREEQYNVLSLATFWRNCGEALAEWCERHQLDDLAARIDRSIETPVWRDAAGALSGLLAFCKELDRRPCLLIDNLDLILTNLKGESWAFRHALQRRDGPVVIGAATQPLRQAGDRKAAFYEFFHPIDLEPLDEAELMHCMRTLADGRGAAGQPVREVLARAPERIRTLYALTGGNPRVLALVYRLMEQTEETDTVLDDLQVLLDEVTAFYKARVEEIQTAQQRAIVDAIALNWDPITSGALSEVTGIPVTTISSQLNRLRKIGFIQQVETSGSYAGYQLAERFLNIWYLMRHGTRRTKQRLRWLTLILARLFSEEELGRLSDRAELRGWRKDYRLSLREAREEITAARYTTEGLGLPAIEENLNFVTAASRPPKAGALSVAAALRTDGQAHATWTFGPPESAVSSSPGLTRPVSDTEVPVPHRDVADELVSKGLAFARSGRPAEALEPLDAVVAQFGASDSPYLQERVSWALTGKGHALAELGHSDEALETFETMLARFGASDRPNLQDRVALTWISKGNVLGQLGRHDEAIKAYDAVVIRFGASNWLNLQEMVAMALASKGHVLGQLGRYDEAIQTYDAVVNQFGASDVPDLQERVATALASKGYALGQLGRDEEALDVFNDVVSRFSVSDLPDLQERVATALTSKANALRKLGRDEEALDVFNDVVNQFGASDLPGLQYQVAHSLVSKGNTFSKLGRHDEALGAYNTVVIQLGASERPDVQFQIAWALTSKGNALDQLGRTDEALEAYEAVVALCGESDLPDMQQQVAWALTFEGSMLGRLGRTDEALEAYDAVVTRFGTSELPLLQARVARALSGKGDALDELGRIDEAFEAYDTVVTRFGTSDQASLQERVIWALMSKASVLGRLGRTDEELEAYDTVVTGFSASELPDVQEQVAWAWTFKGNVLGRLGRTDEALEAYDAMVARFGISDLPEVQERVGFAWISKGNTLNRLGRTDEALEAYDTVMATFGASDLPALQEQAAWAWSLKGGVLGRLGRTDETLQTYDAVVAQFGTSELPTLQALVARALSGRGDTLDDLGRIDEALEAYSAVVARFGASDQASLQERVIKALMSKASALGRLGRLDEALEAYDAVVARCSADGPEDLRRLASNGLGAKGRLLIDQLGRYQEAETCLRDALVIQPSANDAANLVWALIAQGRAGEAQTKRDGLNDVSTEGLVLMDAGIEMVRDNFGNAFDRLGAALDHNIVAGASNYFEDIIWLLRIGVDRGHGEGLIEWFVESHNDDRYAPVYGALVAYVRGERFLRDLNPEVRGLAERLYQQMSAPRKNAPESPVVRRRGRRATERDRSAD